MNRRKIKKLLFPLLSTLLICCIVFTLVISTPDFSGFIGSAAFLSATMVQPKIAFETAGEMLSFEIYGDSLPAAQTKDEDDLSSGWWTALPNGEMTAQDIQAPQAEVPIQGSVITEVTYPSKGEGDRYIQCGTAYIRNMTQLSHAEVAQEVLQPLAFSIELNSESPQVLIMHTHATECYEDDDDGYYQESFSARTTDETKNMVAIGNAMAEVLNAGGINTITDGTLHDYPSYNGSYDRSKATVESYLAQYPSIKIVLDVHRDAIEQTGTRIKPVCNINGEKAAQIMIICGADNGKMNMPDYKMNLRFASAVQAKAEELFPGLMRPVLFDYRNYNQQLTTGSILIEVGGHANSFGEAKYSGRLIATAIADMLKSL